jgi:hypothetical protein
VHPATSQCPARSKRSGNQCKRLVLGGGPCYLHGGRGPQVAAKREQRVLLAEAQAAAPTVIVQREPEEILLDALHDTNATLQAIKAELSAGLVNPILLQLAGDWIDRVGRLGKIIVDGDLSTKLHTRLGWLAEDRAATVWGHLAAVVEASPLSAQQRLVVWESRFDGLRRVADGLAPFRLSGHQVHRFTDTLIAAAAVERAAAEGWLEPEPDVDADSGDVGAPLLFPGNGSVA